MSKVSNITNLPKVIFVVWKNLAAMVSNIKYMQMKHLNPTLHICAIYVRQKQLNLFVIQSQNTQFSLYFVSQVVIQNERLHKLITLMSGIRLVSLFEICKVTKRSHLCSESLLPKMIFRGVLGVPSQQQLPFSKECLERQL